MAYNVSAEYKTALKSNVIVARSYFWILSEDIESNILVSDDTFLKSWKLENLCYDDRDNTLIGNTIAKKLDLKMINSFENTLENKEIELYSGVVLNPNADVEDWETEYVSHGNFIIQPVLNKEVPSTQEFVAYDYMIKFNAQFSTGALTYPCTLLQMLEHICDSVGVALAGTGTYEVFEPFANQNFVITQGEALEDYTYRQILSRICKLSGTIATINSNNELQLRSFGQDIIETMDSNHYYTFEKNTEYGELNEVVLKSYDITGENVTKQDAESIAEYGLTSMSINEELFAYTQDLRNEIIGELFGKLFGAKYTGFKARAIGFNYFDPLDKVTITSTQDIDFNTYIFNQVINFDMGKLTVDFTTTALTSAEEEYKNVDTQELVNQRTEIIVNKHEGEITLLTEEVNENTSSIASINLDIDGIDIEVAKISPLQTQTNNLEIEVGELRSEIGDVTDITVQEEGNGTLTFETINTSEPINITIRPTADADISYLYPSSGLFPSSTTFLKVRTLRFTNTTTSEVFDYILPANLRYLNSTTYDELYLDYGTLTCRVTRKVNIDVDGVKTAKATPVQEDYDYPSIALTAGDYTVTMLGYPNAYMKIRLMSQNMYTSQFATRVELSSAITQSADAINLEVAKKTDKTAIISTINLTSETATIDADKVDIVGVITAMNNDTTTTIDGDKITTGSITASQVSSSIITTTNFSAQNINASKITAGTLNGTVVNVTNLNASNITIGNLQSTNYVLDTSGTKISLSDGTIDTKNFKVSSTGVITATDGSFSGTITATGGTIGGWTLSGNNLTCGATTLNGSTGNINTTSLTATGGTIGGWTIESTQLSGGGKISGGSINIGSGKFTVNTAGTLSATGATISGTITANSGTIAGLKISSTELSNANAALRNNGTMLLYPQVGSGGYYAFNNGTRINVTAGVGIASNSNGNVALSGGNLDVKACSGSTAYLACMINSNGTGERSAVECANGTMYLRSTGVIYANGVVIGGSSSKATKKNIKTLNQEKKDELYELIKNIEIKEYDYKKMYGKKNNYGFVIEDIEKTKLNDLLHITQHPINKKIKTYSSEDLTRLCLITIQELMKKIEKLEDKNE